MPTIPARIPPPPKRRFETLLGQLVTDVRALQAQNPVELDEAGRLQIGDVFFLFETLDDGSISVSLQNAVTNGPPLTIGVLT